MEHGLLMKRSCDLLVTFHQIDDAELGGAHFVQSANFKPKIDELAKIHRRLNSPKTARLPNSLNVHDVHHYSVSYLLMTVVILTIGFFVYKKRKLTKTKTITIGEQNADEQNLHEIYDQPIHLRRV